MRSQTRAVGVGARSLLSFKMDRLRSTATQRCAGTCSQEGSTLTEAVHRHARAGREAAHVPSEGAMLRRWAGGG